MNGEWITSGERANHRPAPMLAAASRAPVWRAGVPRFLTRPDLKDPAFVRDEDVAVTDTFATDTVDVTSPTLFCSPASIDGSPLTDTFAQQCCYKTKGPKLDPPALVGTLGSVGGSLELELGSQSMVCEPCTATVLP